MDCNTRTNSKEEGDATAIKSTSSRSKLPSRTTSEKTGNSGYRERSHERSSDKYRKRHNNSEVPLANTSFNNPIKLPEHQEEQERRGRSRESDKREENESSQDMISLMGFDGFGSTKNKQVKGAKGGGVQKEKKSEYRQYVNRQKGFNRPLSPGK